MHLGMSGWLLVSIIALALWWFGFIATRQMRLDKNKKREEIWAKMAAEKKAASSED